MTNKVLAGVYPAPGGHWVGDGFPVRSLFSYQSHGARVSPFLLLDYAGPAQFEPGERKRGVGEHPHRGFETVTIVYQGEVAHRDSSGAGGTIGPGDVQWMTAAAGIVHDEFHSPEFARRGGTFEMVQLWVNLPARAKMSAPGYQEIKSAEIPVVELAGGAGRVRVIAGEFEGRTGPARTFTPVSVWDAKLNAGADLSMPIAAGHIAALVVLQGDVVVQGRHVRDAQLALFERGGDVVAIEAAADTTLLVLAGEPIDEPVVGHGPFVMNSHAEIRTAIDDFARGDFGRLTG
jgi:redox-sensitive bicupin YhaK (pirin superfamily)